MKRPRIELEPMTLAQAQAARSSTCAAVAEINAMTAHEKSLYRITPKLEREYREAAAKLQSYVLRLYAAKQERAEARTASISRRRATDDHQKGEPA